MNVKKILDSSILTSWFNSIILLLNSFVILFHVITSWSQDISNIWFLFFSVVGFSQIVIFGFAGTFTRFISYSYAGVSIGDFKNIKEIKNLTPNSKFNIKEISQIIGLLRFIYIFITLIFLLFALVIGYFSLQKPLSIIENSDLIYLAGLIVLSTSSLNIYLSSGQLILNGLSKVAVVQKIMSVVNIFGFFVILISINIYGELISIIIVQQSITTIAMFFVFIYSKYCLKTLKITKIKMRYDKNIFIHIYDSAWKSGVSSLSATVVKNTPSILAVQYFPVEQSVIFQFTKRIFDIFEQFISLSMTARVPDLAILRGSGKLNEFTIHFRETQNICYVIFLLGYFALAVLGNKFLDLIGSNLELGSLALLILFAFNTILSRWGAMTHVATNMGNNVIEHKTGTISLIAFIVSVVFFLNTISDPNILVLSLIIAQLSTIPFIVKYSYISMKTSFYKHERNMLFKYLLILFFINVVFVTFL